MKKFITILALSLSMLSNSQERSDVVIDEYVISFNMKTKMYYTSNDLKPKDFEDTDLFRLTTNIMSTGLTLLTFEAPEILHDWSITPVGFTFLNREDVINTSYDLENQTIGNAVSRDFVKYLENTKIISFRVKIYESLAFKPE